MSIRLNTRQIDDVIVVDVAGWITDGEGAIALRDTLRALNHQGRAKILLNLAGASYIDSTGIGVLVRDGYTATTSSGGQFKLLGLSRGIKKSLKITNLYTVFDVYTDETSAISSFASTTAPALQAHQ